MHIEQLRPGILNVTLSSYEMAALASAVKYIVEGTEGELTEDARNQLKQVLASYDDATAKMLGQKKKAAFGQGNSGN